MKFLAIAASALLIGVTAASAGPIEDRQALMKQRGGAMGVLVPIVQEKNAFDAAAVMAALETLKANAESVDIDVLWAPGTEGGKSGPKIWEDRAGFQAASDKFKADAEAAVAANPQDLEALRAVFGPLASNCGSCHEAFRL
jgi:cytochrome c556